MEHNTSQWNMHLSRPWKNIQAHGITNKQRNIIEQIALKIISLNQIQVTENIPGWV